MKNKLITIVIVSILGVTLIMFFVYSYVSSKRDKIQATDNPRGVAQINTYFNYKTQDGTEIKMKNFLQTPLRQVESQGVYLVETDQYGIFYNSSLKQFQISILDQPVEDVRFLAEQQLLKVLDITASQACKLDVYLSGPVSVDERFGDRPNFGLSFCPNSVPFSQDKSLNIR